ncbi:MAG: type II secretion system major pseudopilin GspG [Armatimonadetes bacterium]|nr:type II secretion system major pseudopilin GspG [Armatimonadota bacterium]
MRGQKGFTFLEIMVVVVILGILSALVIPRYLSRVEQAKKTQAVLQIREVMKALELYKLDNGTYPTTEQTLAALVKKPETPPAPKNWHQYLDKVPNDPWGHPLQYVSPGSHGLFDLFSLGPDGQEGGEDDLLSWALPD